MIKPQLWAVLIVLPILAAACQAQSAALPIATPESALSSSLKPPVDCPNLDSRLFQLTQADRPLELAEQWQFKVKDNKVQVLLILNGEDTSFLQNFGVEPGTQIGSKVQAFAPLNQLCDLANAPQVLAIRPPTQVLPQ